MDISNYARSSGIYFGVRGSAAGSLASYCLGITDLDPVEYDLTFERFLNPERVTMPDIDMDFEDTKRSDVIEHVTKHYGTGECCLYHNIRNNGRESGPAGCGPGTSHAACRMWIGLPEWCLLCRWV